MAAHFSSIVSLFFWGSVVLLIVGALRIARKDHRRD